LQALGVRVTRPLTVLQLLPALNAGGVERGTQEVAAALARGGHRSLVMSGGGRLVTTLEAAGSEHFQWAVGHKSLLTLRLVGPLRRFLAAQQVDILHARSRLPAWLAWLALRGMDPRTRPRFVTTVHGLNSVNAYSAVMTRGERVIAVSGFARDYWLAHYAELEPERITVIPRGVDPAAFPRGFQPDSDWLADWYRQYPQTRGRHLVTLPGRVRRDKGLHDFVALIAGLRDCGVPVHGLVVGDTRSGRQRLDRDLRTRIARARLGDALTFTGYRNDVREIMALSNAIVSLSVKPEAFGRTINEALSLGVPVAGYAHGGVGEQLAQHFPAGAVPPGDANAMIDRLARWYAVPPSLQEAGVHSLEVMLRETLELYQELVFHGAVCMEHP
jgi:glycosyltransferase involved in cell wall biosynthesis